MQYTKRRNENIGYKLTDYKAKDEEFFLYAAKIFYQNTKELYEKDIIERKQKRKGESITNFKYLEC